MITVDDNTNTRHLKKSPYKSYPETKITFEKLQNKKSIWRCSSSGRAKVSGEDFTKAISRAYNHTTQLKPVHRLTPAEPDRFEDVEGEERKDDHGVDHYFRPWNVHKQKINDIKKNISSSILWVTKANKNKDFLVELYSSLGIDISFLRDSTKMLWSTTYILCLYECEKYWSSDPAVLERMGKRDALTKLLGLASSNGDSDSDSANSSSKYNKLLKLACWAWNQRFVFQPYTLELGGRIAFDMLQQACSFRDDGGALNIYSGHDYTMIGLLSALQVLQNEGGLTKPIEFAAYITMEMWSKAPEFHHSENKNNLDKSQDKNRDDREEEKDQQGQEHGQEHGQEQEQDQRVLRIIFNDSPFDSCGQNTVHKIKAKYARSRDPREQEAFMYAWPVREERERVILQVNIQQLQVIMTDMHQAMTAQPDLIPLLHKSKSFIEFKEKNL